MQITATQKNMTTTTTDHLGTATYSPDDNKIRLYPFARLSPEDYARVRAAGFIWAPKQKLFVAPMWTPGREDLAIELCGEVGDEDTSLVDRAEQRADRFEDYSEARANDAQSARNGVSAIADNIPLGQPILVGHHSERRARKDAERIENGMRRAVKMWETSKYWTQRAAGALAHAKYKELPRTRARRIKKITSDLRRQQKHLTASIEALKFWNMDGLTHELARTMAGRAGNIGNFRMPKKEGDRPDWQYQPDAYTALSNDNPSLYAPRTLDEVRARALAVFPTSIKRTERWIAHYENRLAYEKAMLEESGASHLLEKKKLPPKAPICNYRAPDGITCANRWGRAGETITYSQVEMTSAQYAAINWDYKGTRLCENSHRVRTAMVKQSLVCVFITDKKAHAKPEPVSADRMAAVAARPLPRPAAPRPEPSQADKDFSAMKDSLKQGVQVVSAPQLFPTPRELANRMVQMADVQPGQRVLEPSAGTGNLIRAIHSRFTGADCGKIVAVEISVALARGLEEQRNKTLYANEANFEVINQDFLAYAPSAIGHFDRVVMNPPFVNGQDIDHIRHAFRHLKPNGKLVAICANGPRQHRELKPWVESLGGTWEVLPPDTFKESGTGVNAVLLSVDA